MTSITGLHLKSKVNREIDNINMVASDEGFIDFYIVNFKEEQGFIIISADKRVMPILAFSNKGKFEIENNESGVNSWISNNKEYIKGIRKGEIIPEKEVTDLWNSLCRFEPIEPGEPTDPTGGGTTYPTIVSNVTKGPLLNTTWSQGCGFNNSCPSSDYGALCYHCPTGCGATGVAQILKYYSYPTECDWNQMPIDYGTPVTAQLMRNIGDLIGMEYGTNASAITDYEFEYDVVDAFENEWGYSTTTHYIDYDGNDYNTVKNEIYYNRPVLFKGRDSDKGGHVWVCDGYIRTEYTTYSTLFFHMNWGWYNGYSNGWFAYNNFNPIGSSGTHYNFDENIGCIIGIKP